ncbi:MAG: carbohydrate-binding family 9-like protein [Deltaproteobacteria bacterium]|nr:carbohydrate-binding family 9-like protein [Deltaproteobacteria bacterium]
MRFAVVVVVAAFCCSCSKPQDDGPPRVEVHKAKGAIVVDGVLDEPDWQRAVPLRLRHYLDKGALSFNTTAKLLWTADALYLAFDADDDDAFSPYSKRDDPLYESEAYEIFIDADGDADVYVELQSNAFDVHFDAAFAGGARKHMEVAYDVDFATRSVVAAGRLVQEWRIPVAALRDVPAGEPRVGATWQANLFRLERRRQDGKVTETEASAWSPPLKNDFHNLQRFGTLVFVE